MNLKRSPLELSKLSIQDLRKLASGYGLLLRRDMNTADIAALVSAHESGPTERVSFVVDDSSRPKPGWARIEIHKDPNPQAANSDVYVGVNGYCVLIRRGVKVDVPIKVLRGSLMDAKTEVLRAAPNESDPTKRYYWEEVYSYPFTVHDLVEGTDPRDTYENATAKRMKPRVEFRKANGFWPKPQELREWQSRTKK